MYVQRYMFTRSSCYQFYLASIILLVGLIALVSGQMIAVGFRSEIVILLIGCSTSYLTVGLMGCALPLESKPYYTRSFSAFLPLTIPTLGLRAALIRGFTFKKGLIIESIAISLLNLLLFSFITLFILHKGIHM